VKFYLKITFLISLTALFNTSCTKKTSESYSYFGGQIVNPKSTKVYFFKNDKILDSTVLKENNSFLFKLKNLNSGLYTFSHGREYQYVFFEKEDSIIIRLNTWDFDESLVFSGKGAERNNFLMTLFLNNEKEDKMFAPFYNLSAKAFDAKIDSVLQIKNNLYNQFKANTKKESDYFNKLVEVAIKYPLYRKKESYPLTHKQQLESNTYPEIDDKFYAFRKNMNLNDNSLVYFFPYRNYVSSYLYHKAYEKKYKNPKSNFSVNLIEYTSNLIKERQLRNVLLYRFISDSFINDELTNAEQQEALKIFNESCDDQEMLSEIKQLAFDYNNIKKGAKLFDFKVINTNGDKLDATSIFKNKKTVLYFWSKKFVDANNLSKRVAYLQKQHPHLNFIGINVDHSKDSWLKSPVFNSLDSKNQFQLAQQCVMRNFITARTPRIILLNNNAIVKNGFTVFWARNFSAELENLEKN
jgi:hypothetical protein